MNVKAFILLVCALLVACAPDITRTTQLVGSTYCTTEAGDGPNVTLDAPGEADAIMSEPPPEASTDADAAETDASDAASEAEIPPSGPTCDDATKNGDETDIDCGGPDCPACGPGLSCLEDSDCASFDVAASGNTPGATVTPKCDGRRVCNPIRHLVYIIQENRSFDHYFGAYRNCAGGEVTNACARGFPVDGDGIPTVEMNDPVPNTTVGLWHNTSSTVSRGSGHFNADYLRQMLCDDTGDPASCSMSGFAAADAAEWGIATSRTVNGLTNATPVVLQTSVAHGFSTGDVVFTENVKVQPNNLAAFNQIVFRITVTDSTHFALDGSTAAGTFKGNGTARKLNWCQKPASGCSGDVLGYHTRDELPTYWSLADSYVLQDGMHESGLVPSSTAHGMIVSGVTLTPGCNAAASATPGGGVVPCKVDISQYVGTNWTMTSMPYQLREAGVSYAYYLAEGSAPTNCGTVTGERECPPTTPVYGDVVDYWDPIKQLATEQSYQSYRQHVSAFYDATDSPNHLPAVSWIAPGQNVSEHGADNPRDGQRYVNGLVNAINHSSDWWSTAIVIFYDDPGGYYDHVQPPVLRTIDGIVYGTGMRVPSILISPYAREGFIDHGTYTFDSLHRLTEDVHLNGARMDPASMSRPDYRPYVGEEDEFLDDMLRAPSDGGPLDFTQTPRAPVYAPIP